MTDFLPNDAGLLVPVEASVAAVVPTTEFVGPRLPVEMERERIREISQRLLLKCLLNVEWGDCTCRTGLFPGGITRTYHEEVLEAAREMKAAGIGWEQYC